MKRALKFSGKALGWTLFTAICFIPWFVGIYFLHGLGKIFFGWAIFFTLVIPTLYLILTFFFSGTNAVISTAVAATATSAATNTAATATRVATGGSIFSKLWKWFTEGPGDEIAIAGSAIGAHIGATGLIAILNGENPIINFKKGPVYYDNGRIRVLLKGNFAGACELEGKFWEKIMQFIVIKFKNTEASKLANKHAGKVLSTLPESIVFITEGGDPNKITGIHRDLLELEGPFDDKLDDMFLGDIDAIEDLTNGAQIVNMYPQSLQFVKVVKVY